MYRGSEAKCKESDGSEKSFEDLEAVQRSLLLLLADGIHAFLKVCSCDLGVASLLTLFFDLEHGPAVLLVHATVLSGLFGLLDLVLELSRTASPSINLLLHLVALSLEISESFLEGLSELLLGEEMLLDGANAGLLVFMNLGDSEIFAARTVGLSWRWRDWNGGCICGR